MTDTTDDLDPAQPDPDEYEEFPEPRRRHWGLVVFLVLLVSLLAAAGLGVRWVEQQIHPARARRQQVAITIPPGSSTAIGELLAQRDVVADARVFRWYVKLLSAGPFQAGDFTFHRRDDMKRVVDVLERARRASRPDHDSGRVDPRADRGTRRTPAGALGRDVQAGCGIGKGALAAPTPGATNLEGLLYPDTYYVTDADDETDILTRMVARFDQVAGELGYTGTPQAVGRSPYETVIVASMVEREAKVPEDGRRSRG